MGFATDCPQLFRDAERGAIGEERPAGCVIGRVLEHGTLASIRSLFCTYAREAIIDVICHSRRRSRRTGFFWRASLEIQVPIACLAPRSRSE